MPQPDNTVYQIKVSLLGTQPLIWRRLLIAPDTTFQDLHRIIQLAMGWYSSHLHLFQADDARLIGDPAEDFDGMLEFRDETLVTVSAVLKQERQALKYQYDFGDSWEHEVLLEKILSGDQDGPLPRCIKGVRQCPPEDVGGLPGFYEFLDIMEDAAHPDHVEMREWIGGEDEWFDPEFVDLDDINEALAEREALFSDAEGEAEAGIPPVSDLFGLDPSEVHELLQNPLNCPSVFKPLINAEAVNRELDTAPVIRMAKVLVEEIGDKGICLTGKGNLPLKQVNAMVAAGGENVVLPMAGYRSVRSEQEVLAVSLTRLLLDLAGYTKKQKGRLLLKKPAAKRLAIEGWLTVYQDILHTALSRFNWAWVDHYEGMEDVQYIGPFCFWLLSEKGDEWLPVEDYLSDMLKAFPRLPLAAYPVSYASEEQQARWVLDSRMIRLFRWLGLIELDPEHARFREEGQQMMRRTALFEGVFVRV